MLVQREADAPDQAALQLAACRFRVEQPSDIVRRDDAWHANLSDIALDRDLDEHSPERVQTVLQLFVARFCFGARLEGSALATDHRSDGLTRRRIVHDEKPSVLDRHAVGGNPAQR